MSEAYLKDIPKPLKVLLGEVYERLEANMMAAVLAKWPVDCDDLEEMKRHDRRAVEIEEMVLRRNIQDGPEARDWNAFLLSAGWFGRWPTRTELMSRFVRVCKRYGIE